MWDPYDLNNDGKRDIYDDLLANELFSEKRKGGSNRPPSSGDGCNSGCVTIFIIGILVYIIFSILFKS